MSRRPSTPLREARDNTGLSRERVAALLDPPTSSKTIERWEEPGTNVKRWRLKQLAEIYGVAVDALENGKVAA